MPRLTDVFDRLTEALAAQVDQPTSEVRDGFERLIAVSLESFLDAKRAGVALESLRNEGLLEPEVLGSLDPKELADTLTQGRKPPPPRSVATLQRLARWYQERDLANDADSVSTETLREELNAINGIGPSTADELLSRGLGRPAFAVSRAAYRVLLRHGWLDASCTYEDARDLIESLAPENAPLLAVLAQGFESIGTRYCRASVARCERCPLRPLLPDGGPIEPES
jgi:endonuclease-3 related protein